jgi:hypothetical protein
MCQKKVSQKPVAETSTRNQRRYNGMRILKALDLNNAGRLMCRLLEGSP